MKVTNTSERLKEVMRERGLRQRDILELVAAPCQKYGVKLNRNDLSQYVNGKTEPGQEKLTILSMALNVSEPWLMGYEVDRAAIPPGTATLPSTKQLPRLGAIACGTPILAEQNILGYDSVPEWVNADFTLICKGDSMTGARINDGDVVCIKAQPEVEPGQIAAVLIGEEATLKRVRYLPNGGGVALWPENPKYEPLVYAGADAGKVRVLGLATHFISKIL